MYYRASITSLCITVFMDFYNSYVVFHVWNLPFLLTSFEVNVLLNRIYLQMWPDLIAKSKEGGADVIQTYVFWSGHEPVKGKVWFPIQRFAVIRSMLTLVVLTFYLSNPV